LSAGRPGLGPAPRQPRAGGQPPPSGGQHHPRIGYRPPHKWVGNALVTSLATA